MAVDDRDRDVAVREPRVGGFQADLDTIRNGAVTFAHDTPDVRLVVRAEDVAVQHQERSTSHRWRRPPGRPPIALVAELLAGQRDEHLPPPWPRRSGRWHCRPSHRSRLRAYRRSRSPSASVLPSDEPPIFSVAPRTGSAVVTEFTQTTVRVVVTIAYVARSVTWMNACSRSPLWVMVSTYQRAAADRQLDPGHRVAVLAAVGLLDAEVGLEHAGQVADGDRCTAGPRPLGHVDQPGVGGGRRRQAWEAMDGRGHLGRDLGLVLAARVPDADRQGRRIGDRRSRNRS